jgi:putative oxidoreductase
MNAIERYAPLVGRILLSLIFIISGAGKIFGFSGTAAFMAAQGLPLASLLLAATIALEIVGGLSLLLGFRARALALLLFLFLIPTTIIFHNFWAASGEAAQMQMGHFLKNLGIMGGLLYVVAYGAGPLSVDNARAAGTRRA